MSGRSSRNRTGGTSGGHDAYYGTLGDYAIAFVIGGCCEINLVSSYIICVSDKNLAPNSCTVLVLET